jgi:hypothetical protein
VGHGWRPESRSSTSTSKVTVEGILLFIRELTQTKEETFTAWGIERAGDNAVRYARSATRWSFVVCRNQIFLRRSPASSDRPELAGLRGLGGTEGVATDG